MPLKLIEGDPTDRRILATQGRRAIESAQDGPLVLDEDEKQALTQLHTTLGKLNKRENGLVFVTSDVTPYTDATSLDGEDPLLAAYSIYEDQDPEKGEF